MKLYLYKNQSSANTIGKVLGEELEIDITLKRSVDVVAPTILLRERNGVDYLGFDYASIPALGRMYFINQVENVNGTIWSLSLDCDVLETYKVGILASTSRYLRGIKPGDYADGDLEMTINRAVEKHMSTVTLDPNVHTNVLTVLQKVEN